MKYRRRQDAGTTRVYIGRKRERIIRVLITAETSLSAQGLAHAARVKLTTVQHLLEHLQVAGWVDINDEHMLPTYMLNYGGEAYAAALLAPLA